MTKVIFALAFCGYNSCYLYPTNYRPFFYETEAECKLRIEPFKKDHPTIERVGCVQKTIPVATPWEPVR